MSKGTRKITGFLWAMLLAVLSFFVIFIFFQDVSVRAFGVSMKHPERIGQAISDAVKNTTDKVTGAVSDAVDKVIDQTVDKAVASVTESLDLNNFVPEGVAIENPDIENLDLGELTSEATAPVATE